MPVRTVNKNKLSDLGEFGLINRIRKKMKVSSSVARGIGDDTAVVLTSSKKNLLLTTDMLVEDVHFTKKMPARAIGHKAIAASISDIAAMGGTAKHAVIALGVPASCPTRFISDLYEGIRRTAKRYQVDVVGGDTVKCSKVVINVTLTGEANKKDIVYRNGARKGDQIFVTGPLGQSLSSGWHLRFTPRAEIAKYLVRKLSPTAMIDISDGLAADLGHILKESRVGAVIEEVSIPHRRGARLNNALYDGEDFELLFTLSSRQADKLKKSKDKRFKFYHIGEISNLQKGLTIRNTKGALKKINSRGYAHF